ncbi:hypothetical protein [Ferribacterium limneticum]|uniref:hypothetical protein n=1 Tax=Ferribacterium limneticum TaxID=76259 RepID=UPI001CF7EE3D|nr:hypothetical protein [Ferribacterium limneticum]UCV26729.1 hypothetical protein KI617_10450 [Ferribacterium limneticum]UCV30646.1 hypothetical protein KI608_10450 [Ferribacterium limneticum]
MIWSPKPPEFYEFKSELTGKEFKPNTPASLAEWNLQWLFNYAAYAALDGTVQGITAHYTALDGHVSAGIEEDVESNTFGIRELATTCSPVAFMNAVLRRPYKQTMIYTLAGAEVWKEARAAAERLELNLASVTQEAQAEAAKVIQSAKIYEFKKRA